MARRRDLLRLTRMVKDILQLQEWGITVRFDDAMNDTGECNADKWPYREATITYAPKRIPNGQALAYAVHEGLHCHVEPLAAFALALCKDDPVKRKVCADLEEELVTRLEHIVCGLLGTLSSKPAP